MFVLSLEQAVAAIAVCCFVFGIVCDRTFIWFQQEYCCEETEE